MVFVQKRAEVFPESLVHYGGWFRSVISGRVPTGFPAAAKTMTNLGGLAFHRYSSDAEDFAP